MLQEQECPHDLIKDTYLQGDGKKYIRYRCIKCFYISEKEELWPEKVNDAVYCECPFNTMSFADLNGIRKCDNCHRLTKQRAKQVQPTQFDFDAVRGLADYNRSLLTEEEKTKYCQHSYQTIMFHTDKSPSCMLCDKPIIPFRSVKSAIQKEACVKQEAESPDTKSELEALHKEKKKYKEAWLDQFKIIREMAARQTELLKIIHKLRNPPQGNPFKVGDVVKIFSFTFKTPFAPLEYVEAESIVKIDKIQSDILFAKDLDGSGFWVSHYKQCEKVEG